MELAFSDSSSINLGCIVGKDGKDGINGTDGKDGANGADGKDGEDGKDGANGVDGKDGIGIANVTITDDGVLNVELTNGTTLNLGSIKGKDGIGISKSEINADGEFVLTYTNGQSTNLGKVVGADGINGTNGADGKDGINGADGKDGRGIADMAIINGEIVITYTDGTKSVIGKSDDVILNESDTLEFTLLSDGTYAVTGCLVDNPTEITIPSKFNGKFVTKIYSNAFENIITLKTVNIPNSILSIGTRAFYGCNTLKNVNISTDSELQEIAGYAFYGCSALTDIYFPTYVDYIGAYAFYQSGLTTAVFECPTNWNLFGKWNNGYPAHLSPTDSANAAKALSTNYTSHTSSDFYKNAWIRNDSYSNGSIVGTYEREL